MPTHVTYDLPGHQSRIGPSPVVTPLTDHSQATLPAPDRRNRVTTCRQALIHSLGDARIQPHGYQFPFISWAKLMTTGWP